ncbi:MAG: tRNA pseudouridine(55) synthase TruB [Aquabacterium sp.]|uniref:tRNA pseudouridine(55) synthase TruB n=1 Tax=Aquabacterium sp. TaxID=1872578 RepID=UPI0012183C08|nr:tRNA pseudouridine(55) synthase TruB [Aquabacterium sp.]TAK85738.1 MAG: tRNA pseudouridine(55) synthase TruB [Aquabacterium sp.]
MNKPVRQPRRQLHGVILLDKPLGLSSNDALQKVRRLMRAEKAGHTGTLDPLATGLLPLCFGAATKFSQVSLDADKRYTATLKLGQATTTGDAEGEILQTRPVTAEQVNEASIAQACQAFTGPISQIPPMHSALKHQGRALYEYAREGIEIERPARDVTIHAIDIVSWHGDELVLDVRCSKGTYIRTLAQDIGERLGCGAHLIGLRRTGSGGVCLQGAVTLEALLAMTEPERDAYLQPADVLLNDWPDVMLSESEAARFLTGLRRRTHLADAAQVRVYGPVPGLSKAEGRVLLGSAHIKAGELIPTRLLSPAEVQGLLEVQAAPQPTVQMHTETADAAALRQPDPVL